MTKEIKQETKKESKTGKYVYDKKLGKVVKVSDEVVGLNKGGGDFGSSCPTGSCCPGGSCGL